jgi:hypothetical protein
MASEAGWHAMAKKSSAFSLFGDKSIALDFLQRLERFMEWTPIGGGWNGLFDTRRTDLTPLLSSDPNAVKETFDKSGVHYHVRDVADEEADNYRGIALTSPLVAPGDRLIAYRAGDKIIGFAEAGDEVASLRKELDQLRREVAQLRHQ